LLAGHLHGRGELNPEEAFVNAASASASKYFPSTHEGTLVLTMMRAQC
jgi:hypothetical protein